MNSKKLKYQKYTNELLNCPPITYKEIENQAEYILKFNKKEQNRRLKELHRHTRSSN